MPQLTGEPTPITLDARCTLEAPDLIGAVDVTDARTHVRASGHGAQEQSLLDALDAEEMETALMFEMEVEEDRAPKGRGDRHGGRRRAGLQATTRQGEEAIILRMDRPPAGKEVAVLYTDEQGVSRWVFPQKDAATRGRSGRELTFHLPRKSAPVTPAQSKRRGPISKLGRRMVRMLMWKTDDIVGQGVNRFVSDWEQRKRPYGWRAVRGQRFTPNPDWDALRQGRALLLLHGTFSMGEIAFDGLLRSPVFPRLADYYGDRIIAFNHPSLHHSPRENVQTMLDLLPHGVTLDLDIVTHSRGGLVGRVLTEQLAALDTGPRTLHVRRAIFVAAPLRGTILADGDNWIDLIDRYTNLLTNLPDNAYTLLMEALLAAVKIVGHAGLAALSGLNSMWPDGDFLRALNGGAEHDTEYYALSADFQPREESRLKALKSNARDMLIDALFGEENDGVVPTTGCYAINTEASGFPLPEERRKIWSLQSDIHHTNYFVHDEVNDQIAKWLMA